MKINKIILAGVIFILIAGIIFITDILNPLIRPITYLFLMGSSKGKDIMFFTLLGIFLITSQLIKNDIDNKKFLKISIIIGLILLISGIALEIIFRSQMGIALNTVFCSMTDKMSSTSILHTHTLKAILGKILVNTIGPFIQTEINTGAGLYPYIPPIADLVIILVPIFFIFLILANQKRTWAITIILSFFSACFIIGPLDGGLFATPSIVGLCGTYFIYRNEHYVNRILGNIFKDDSLIEYAKEHPPSYENKGYTHIQYLFQWSFPYLLVGFIILLRLTVCFAGAEPDYYTVEIMNPADNIEFGEIPMEKIDNNTYHVNPSYNEMDLINDLKLPLKDKCEYYTVSWNIYSYH